MNTPNIDEGHSFRGFSSAPKTGKPADRGAQQPIHADYDIFSENPQLVSDLEKISPGFEKWLNQQQEQKEQAEREKPEGSPFKTNQDLFPNSLMEQIALEKMRPGQQYDGRDSEPGLDAQDNPGINLARDEQGAIATGPERTNQVRPAMTRRPKFFGR